MSLESETVETNQAVYDEFRNYMDLKSWSEARTLIAKAIDKEYNTLAKTLQDEYNNEVCQDCLGTGNIVEGDFDNQISKKCVCQLK